MSFTARCPHCQRNIQIPDPLAGQACNCPLCRQGFTAPFPTLWWVALPGEQPVGPISQFDMQRWIETGLIDQRYLIQQQGGSPEWLPITELFARLPSGPGASFDLNLPQLPDAVAVAATGAPALGPASPRQAQPSATTPTRTPTTPTTAPSAHGPPPRVDPPAAPADAAGRGSASHLPAGPPSAMADAQWTIPRVRDPARGRYADEIRMHVHRHINPVARVLADSSALPIDVLMVPPAGARDWITLVTSGMSDFAMPGAADPFRMRAELIVSLPRQWRLLEDVRHSWPVDWLRRLARLPRGLNTWLAPGHTIPNGDPAQPLAAGTDFCCWLIWNPLLVAREFHRFHARDNEPINFYAIYPLYREEMRLKLTEGVDALIGRLDRVRVDEVLDMSRRNVCAADG